MLAKDLWAKFRPAMSLRDEYNRTREWVFIVGLLGIVIILLDFAFVVVCLAYYGLTGTWFMETDRIISVVGATFLTGFACVTFTGFVED